MTTVRKCLDTPAMGSTVSEQAGPEQQQTADILDSLIRDWQDTGCLKNKET
jgi:hypothetical protein